MPFGKRQDPVLREGDQLQLDEVADLLAQLDQGPERGQRRVADVDVGADQAGPLGDLPEDRLAGAALDVVVGQERLALGPGEDALDQRAALVVARLADGQDRVHVDVRVDERRREEPARGVELAAAVGGDRAGGPDRRDPVALDRQVDGLDRTAERGMDARVADDQSVVATGTSGRTPRRSVGAVASPRQGGSGRLAADQPPGVMRHRPDHAVGLVAGQVADVLERARGGERDRRPALACGPGS